ncbi:hypothetical protein BCD20_19760 [Escherichia coli]|nr:hypothetical protein BCD20_19760 [Escherichia coli]
MSKIAIGREMVDLAPIFQALPERNYLMNALDLFDGVPERARRCLPRYARKQRITSEPCVRYASEDHHHCLMSKREPDPQAIIRLLNRACERWEHLPSVPALFYFQNKRKDKCK